jgi:hypothetical protein
MGTSASGTGPRPTTPLIPNWITDVGAFPNAPENDNSDERSDFVPADDKIDYTVTPSDNSNGTTIANISIPNRYSEARKKFTSFSKTRASGSSDLPDSLKSYVRKGGGGSSTLAKRMRPSTSRIAKFHSVVNVFKEQGAATALKSFNLESYGNKPLLDVLSALTDAIFDNSSPYKNIQDDSITKLAYTNTINRIVEIEGIDLDALSNENVEVMMAIFIEETIVTRVICDIGTSLFKTIQDCQEIIEIEETTYQIVSGLVRNQIMLEIAATQRGRVESIEKNIENIYRIAFDCIAGTIQ